MKNYYRYWGKADIPIGQWHPLVCHMLDVAAVSREVANNNELFIDEWSQRLSITEKQLLDLICFFAAIHDIGKFASDFQCKIPELSKQLQGIAAPYMTGESHPSSAWLLWNKILKDPFYKYCKIEKGDKLRELTNSIHPLLSAAFGHHGGPVSKPNNDSPLTINKLYGDGRGDAALEYILDLLGIFHGFQELIDSPNKIITNRKVFVAFSFILSGLIILSDWTASDSNNFKPLLMNNEPPSNIKTKFADIQKYFNHSCEIANIVICRQGLVPVNVRKISDPWSYLFSSFADAGYNPSPLQTTMLNKDLIVNPGLYIVEDAAGSGKTEAALLLTARLMENGGVDGFYFGLPTMATSNGMYDRITGIYKRFFEDGSVPSLILAHGGSGLHEEYQKSIIPDMKQHEDYQFDNNENVSNPTQIFQNTSPAACSEWIADRSRKVFLAQVGIGSIDQAMLSVIYSRHNTLRMFGLSRRILIIDEVHAYDVYMQKILQHLIQFQASQNKSVILLSATLPTNMKHQLEDAYRGGLCLHEDIEYNESIDDGTTDPYPLVTIVTKDSTKSIPVGIREDNRRKVLLNYQTSINDSLSFLKSVSSSGKCAVWIRNTVADVQNAYDILIREPGIWKIMIFHSRFAMGHRQEIERRVLDTFGKWSTRDKRQGVILLASQVVEQSLDLDFDEMVTDLCPVDLVIQRSGRLHRHIRDKDGNSIHAKDERGDPILNIYGPDPDEEIPEEWYASYFPGAAYVYSNPGILWRTARVLKDERSIVIPERSRYLVEQVYGPSAPKIPTNLEKASGKSISREYKNKAIASGNLFPLHNGFVRPDDTNPWPDATAPTRLSEDTETYRLCIIEDGSLKPLIQDSMHPWPMSEINFRKLAIQYNSEMSALIYKMNYELYDKGRGGTLLPLIKQDNNNGVVYTSVGRTDNGRSFKYDEISGLQLVES